MRSKYELKTEKELKDAGGLTDYKLRPRICPKGYKVDYFGLFDNIAIMPNGVLRLIAVKGHGGVPKKLRKAIENVQITHVTKEIWTYKSDGSVRREIV